MSTLHEQMLVDVIEQFPTSSTANSSHQPTESLPNKRQNRLLMSEEIASSSSSMLVDTDNFNSMSSSFQHNTSLQDCISSLPVDLQFEIASYLTADSLLQVTRVSRGLRHTFLSKSSRHIWTTCLANLDAPPCPEDLSKPRYTSLLFDKFCNYCYVPGEMTTIYICYELRARICIDCKNKHLKNGAAIAGEFDERLQNKRSIYTLIPSWDDELNENPKWYPYKHFLKPDFIDALKGYREAKAIGYDKLKTYVHRMQRRRRAILKHCDLIRDWQRRRAGLTKHEAWYDYLYEDESSSFGSEDDEW